MKFAIAALLGCASALKVTQKLEVQQGCLSHEMTDKGFESLDANQDGTLSYDELKVGIDKIAGAVGHQLTAPEIQWIKSTIKTIDVKNPGSVDKQEFYEFANAVFTHFNLCHLVNGGKGGSSSSGSAANAPKNTGGQCFDSVSAHWIFTTLDANKQGWLSYSQMYQAIQGLAASQNHQLTQQDIEWMKNTGLAIDQHNKEQIDFGEFQMFFNALYHHYGLCPNQNSNSGNNSGNGSASQGGCLSMSDTNKGFDYLDKNKDGELDKNELKAGVELLAKSYMKKTLNQQDWDFVAQAAQKFDTVKPGFMDRDEFFGFVNDLFEHFGLCAKMRADKGGQQKREAEEDKKYHEYLKNMDWQNHDGKLNMQEAVGSIKWWVNNHFKKPFPDSLRTYVEDEFHKFDTSGDGELEFPEFKKWFQVVMGHVYQLYNKK